MLTAKEAREMSTNIDLKKIEKKIRRQIKDGYTYCELDVALSKEKISALEDAGYKVRVYSSYRYETTLITW
jgi:hypothetical protein